MLSVSRRRGRLPANRRSSHVCQALLPHSGGLLTDPNASAGHTQLSQDCEKNKYLVADGDEIQCSRIILSCICKEHGFGFPLQMMVYDFQTEHIAGSIMAFIATFSS